MRYQPTRYKGLREEDARTISPAVFRRYVEERGWVQTFKGDFAVYRRPGSTEFEVIVVNDVEEDAYTVRAIQSIHSIARFEKRAPEEVLTELMDLSSLSEAEFQEVATPSHKVLDAIKKVWFR